VLYKISIVTKSIWQKRVLKGTSQNTLKFLKVRSCIRCGWVCARLGSLSNFILYIYTFVNLAETIAWCYGWLVLLIVVVNKCVVAQIRCVLYAWMTGAYGFPLYDEESTQAHTHTHIHTYIHAQNIYIYTYIYIYIVAQWIFIHKPILFPVTTSLQSPGFIATTIRAAFSASVALLHQLHALTISLASISDVNMSNTSVRTSVDSKRQM